MSMFTLAISCSTVSNLPWFMDLTSQVPVQYCSLPHHILLSSPEISTTEHHFQFGPDTSFFLELLEVVLHSFLVAYWTLSDLQDSSFGVISFGLFMLFTGFSQWVSWGGLPFRTAVDHVLSELSTMTRLSWLVLHSMAEYETVTKSCGSLTTLEYHFPLPY